MSPFKVGADVYHAWCRTLTQAEYDRECAKRYRVTEYCVTERDEHGDGVNVDFHDKKSEALIALETAEFDDDIVEIEVEKVVSWYSGGDGNLEDREYTTIKTRIRE